MRLNFDASLALVLRHEGGYVNHPRDPGGATNRGVTQAVYDDWRVGNGHCEQSVKLIAPDEVRAIYKKRYWDKIRGDDLPAGIDYCVFDFAVNSGVSRASRYLQEAVGVDVDGVIGQATIAAVKAEPADRIINEVCTLRQRFLEGLRTFPTFGKGWTRRVAEVEVHAKVML